MGGVKIPDSTMVDIEEIFTKHDISKTAQKELKDAFEKMIILYSGLGTKTKKVESICKGTFYKGTSKEKPCTFKSKNDGYCSRHDPVKKECVKKEIKKEGTYCNFTIKKTGKKCPSSGTVKCSGSNYCKRHSDMI